MYGKGLNSIRWRFALASAVLTAVALGAYERLFGSGPSQGALPIGVALLMSAAAGALTYLMAGRLTRLIASLERSAVAVAAGEFDRPVDVDCACEIGGLAQSFRRMTSRMNANLLRINLLAYTDPITGLPNRAAIDQVLSWALAPERPEPFRAAIVFIDLDGFKRINDTLGHDGGDELLRQAAGRILEHGLQRDLRTLDTCMDEFGNPCQRLPKDIVFARFAGDEFVALLPGETDRTRLAAVGERVIAALREPFRVKHQEVSVGASVGIAITPDDTACAAELLTFADQAMYSSKQAGKARFMFFDKAVRAAIVERGRTEADLRQGLERGEFELHFQPKLAADTQAFDGVEALVRWRHPGRGLLPPSDFIEVAEQSGLMVPLGRLVLQLAVRQCRAWVDQGEATAVAVNVSPAQFADPSFVDGVLGTLRQVDLPRGLVSIEITESMAMADFETTARRLAELRAAGVRIAIDDFGIGFSNLSMLSRLPVDELKIDRSLVREIGRSAKHEDILRAVLGMAHALGYKTIAEGVETLQQQRFMAALGCHAVQGFLYGRPMPPAALAAWRRAQADASAAGALCAGP